MNHLNTSVIVDLQPQPLTTRYHFFSFRDLPGRKEALEEGYLVDVTSLTNVSFNVPVAMTREVWEYCVVINQADLYKQNFRLISILNQAKIAIKNAPPKTTDVSFDITSFPRNINAHLNKQRLCIAVGPGDQDEPVLTLMMDSQRLEAA